MSKIAFKAELPATLFNDEMECMRLVAKPMLKALRQQAIESNLEGTLRLSMMIEEDYIEPDLVKSAVHIALQ